MVVVGFDVGAAPILAGPCAVGALPVALKTTGLQLEAIAGLNTLAEPTRRQILEALRSGATCDHPKTQRTCKNLLALEPALFTFLSIGGVDPTNNLAERALRGPVLWRKRTSGCKSDRGARFAERILSVLGTLRLHTTDAITWLIDAIHESSCGKPPPSLLLPHVSPAPG